MPSQALSKQGHKVYTLDANWDPNIHTDITHERLKEIKRDFIPLLGGKKGNISHYMGDVALLKEDKSALKDCNFDLVYFWGSLYSDGICSSVSRSRAPVDHGINIKFEDRILKVLPCINKAGNLLAVSGIFTDYFIENMDGLNYFNKRLLDLVLYWANYSEKPVKNIGVIGYSREALKQRYKEQQSEIETKLFMDSIQQIIESEDYSAFGKVNNYERLRKATEKIDRRALDNLGEIDAVFIQYD